MKTVGLALGSGGWRGLAHIGVIKALAEYGIIPNYITGSSAGSLIGGLYAHFGDINLVESFFIDLDYQDLLYIFSDPSNKLGLIKGKKAHHYLNEYLKNADFSSLKISFTAVVTNLRSGQAETINSGNLAKAILASSSIPLIFEPTYESENIYVDGGIAATVPTNFLPGNTDYIIGVNLYQSIFPITKESKQLSKIEIAVITYQLLLNQQAKSNLLNADIAIEPPIKDALFDSFKKFVNNKEAVQAGYDATISKIEKIKTELLS